MILRLCVTRQRDHGINSSPKIGPHIYGHLIFDKVPTFIGKDDVLIDDPEGKGNHTEKKINIVSYLIINKA